MGNFIYFLLNFALNVASFLIIAWVIIGWLVAFGVVNLRHPVAGQIWRFLDVTTGAMLRPLQRFIPPVGGFDFTPFIALVVIEGVQRFLLPWIFAPIINMLGG
jgi:YggT family protein